MPLSSIFQKNSGRPNLISSLLAIAVYTSDNINNIQTTINPKNREIASLTVLNSDIKMKNIIFQSANPAIN